MTLKEITDKITDIIDAYAQVDLEYADKHQLQEWRKDLSICLFYIADKHQKRISKAKIYYEGMKSAAKSEAMDYLKALIASGEMERESEVALRERAARTDVYKTWLTQYAESYGSWDALKQYSETAQGIIYAIGSHIQALNQAEKSE